jgi:hypothetical protein
MASNGTLSEAQNPNPPPPPLPPLIHTVPYTFIQYTYSHREGEGQQLTNLSRKYKNDRLYVSPVYKL